MDKAMSFVRTPAPPCIAEEDSRDESDGGGEDRSMMGDVDDRGEDERGNSGAWREHNIAVVGDLRFRDAAGSAWRPEPAAIHFRQYSAMSSSIAEDFLTPARDAVADAARTAEAWEEVAVKVQASPTSGQFIRAREAAVSEPSDTGLRAIWREERRSPVGGSSEGSTSLLLLGAYPTPCPPPEWGYGNSATEPGTTCIAAAALMRQIVNHERTRRLNLTKPLTSSGLPRSKKPSHPWAVFIPLAEKKILSQARPHLNKIHLGTIKYSTPRGVSLIFAVLTLSNAVAVPRTELAARDCSCPPGSKICTECI
ncbi:hypothetical protein B0H13DRAFT_2287121 [Mycena leptocephala]|nr:hypothetical protein B0H13DRAFT_2287121 [Mycena leptocephala]